MRISDWSSDVCSSDRAPDPGETGLPVGPRDQAGGSLAEDGVTLPVADAPTCLDARGPLGNAATVKALALPGGSAAVASTSLAPTQVLPQRATLPAIIGNVLVDALVTDCHLAMAGDLVGRSEEHPSELQSLMRTSYAVF